MGGHTINKLLALACGNLMHVLMSGIATRTLLITRADLLQKGCT